MRGTRRTVSVLKAQVAARHRNAAQAGRKKLRMTLRFTTYRGELLPTALATTLDENAGN
jgi:hypothetical protein